MGNECCALIVVWIWHSREEQGSSSLREHKTASPTIACWQSELQMLLTTARGQQAAIEAYVAADKVSREDRHKVWPSMMHLFCS